MYEDALNANPGSTCAVKGLNATTRASRREARLCEEAKKTASADPERARVLYTRALEENVESECAAEGLAPPAGKSFKERIEDWAAFVPDVLAAVGGVLAAIFLLGGFLLLVLIALRRLLQPSLAIKPFTHEGTDLKIGAAVSALIEKELIDLSRKGRQAGDGYSLDVVVANVELLARESDLATAVGGLAEVSQLKAIVAVLAAIDRLFGRRSLVVEGELVPEGDRGSGLVTALYRHNELCARAAHWAEQPPAPAAADENDKLDPEPYYGLARPAASWVQYEAARGLDSHVGLVTESPESFARLAKALALQRSKGVDEAMQAYAEALAIDPDNVAALVNLALLVARYCEAYEEAIVLLVHAGDVLRGRYEELR